MSDLGKECKTLVEKKDISHDITPDTTELQGKYTEEELIKDLKIVNIRKEEEKGLEVKKELTLEYNNEINESETNEKTKELSEERDNLIKEPKFLGQDHAGEPQTETVYEEEEDGLDDNQDALEQELSLKSIYQKENQLETDLKQRLRKVIAAIISSITSKEQKYNQGGDREEEQTSEQEKENQTETDYNRTGFTDQTLNLKQRLNREFGGYTDQRKNLDERLRREFGGQFEDKEQNIQKDEPEQELSVIGKENKEENKEITATTSSRTSTEQKDNQEDANESESISEGNEESHNNNDIKDSEKDSENLNKETEEEVKLEGEELEDLEDLIDKAIEEFKIFKDPKLKELIKTHDGVAYKGTHFTKKFIKFIKDQDNDALTKEEKDILVKRIDKFNENSISEKNSDEKEDKKTQIEIPEDFFLKVKNGYQCKDKNLLNKIYEIQKSFPKTELWLKNQGCKNVPSMITIHRLVKESFKSKSEYENWRYDIKLREIKDIAEKKLGKCLSTECINHGTKLKFRCEKGHEFEAKPVKIKFGGRKGKGTWCPTCSKNKKLTLKEFQEIARERGGECLSTEYKNTSTKLRFRCKKGHEFEITPEHVKYRDQWCPIFTESVSERICRGLFEAIFNKDFKKARPEWLKNSEGRQLELDGYNDELNLAFERQGIQHYEFPNYFHKTIRQFESQLSNDQEKGELCETNGVTLIEVPYWIKYDEYQDYIVKQCKTKGLEIPEIELKIDWKKFKWNIDDDSNRDDDNDRSLMEWM